MALQFKFKSVTIGQTFWEIQEPVEGQELPPAAVTNIEVLPSATPGYMIVRVKTHDPKFNVNFMVSPPSATFVLETEGEEIPDEVPVTEKIVLPGNMPVFGR